MNTLFGQYRRRQDRTVTGVVAAVCTLGFLGAVSPGFEDAVTIVLSGAALFVVALIVARWVLRRRRERREDRADTLTAVAWRAAHLRPDHPLVVADRAGGARLDGVAVQGVTVRGL